MLNKNLAKLYEVDHEEFVTIYKTHEQLVQEEANKRVLAGQNVLENHAEKDILRKAREAALMQQSPIELDYNDIEDFHFSTLSEEAEANTDTIHNETFIFQSSDLKIIAETSETSHALYITAYDRGRPRTLTPATEEAILEYLKAKAYVATENCDEITEVQDKEEVLREISQTPNLSLSEEEKTELKLQYKKLIDEMISAYSVEEVTKYQEEIQSIENQLQEEDLPEAPGFEEACLQSFQRILDNKNCFIDDLDQDLLELGLKSGQEEKVVKRKMVDRALQLYMKGMSPSVGKPLKINRAQKLMDFAQIVGRTPVSESNLLPRTRVVAETIFHHASKLTPKPQRDFELIEFYGEFLMWLGK